MSQSLLYHAFGVREGYDYQKTEYVEGRVEFHLRVQKDRIKCPECASASIQRRGGRTRRIRSVPIGLKEVVLVVEVPQLHCPACNKTFEVSPPLPEPMSDTAFPWLDSSAS